MRKADRSRVQLCVSISEIWYLLNFGFINCSDSLSLGFDLVGLVVHLFAVVTMNCTFILVSHTRNVFPVFRNSQSKLYALVFCYRICNNLN